MIYLLLPAYNEAPEIEPLFASVDNMTGELNEPLEIILVDDGSSDGTADTAENTPCQAAVTAVRHEQNKGLGGALQTGFSTIAGKSSREDDVIITMDTDNTHSPTYIPRMVDKLREENLDLVVASRYAPGGEEIGVPFHRRMLSRAASVFYQGFYRTPGIRDYTCGYRAYRAGIIRHAIDRFGDKFVEERGFPSTGEILLKIRALSNRMGEVPFSLHYEMKHTPSKMPKIQTVLHTLRILLKYRSLG
jgi:dolichol-phosphate mannosyltransferase